VFIKLWLDDKLSTIITILLLRLIEPDVFQMPQLHKHLALAAMYRKIDTKQKQEFKWKKKYFLRKDKSSGNGGDG
jgi:hypothetical protein